MEYNYIIRHYMNCDIGTMYKQRRRERAVEREINIQKEAYLRAMKELNE